MYIVNVNKSTTLETEKNIESRRRTSLNQKLGKWKCNSGIPPLGFLNTIM
mgnify:CR=1 FL=1